MEVIVNTVEVEGAAQGEKPKTEGVKREGAQVQGPRKGTFRRLWPTHPRLQRLAGRRD